MIAQCFKFDPNKRISASAALSHHYFMRGAAVTPVDKLPRAPRYNDSDKRKLDAESANVNPKRQRTASVRKLDLSAVADEANDEVKLELVKLEQTEN